MEYDKKQLTSLLDEAFKTTDKALENFDPDFRTEEVGTVVSVGEGIARVEGLRSVRSDELLKFSGNQMGVAFNLDPDEIGVILLDQSLDIQAGSEVRRTGSVVNVPVGEALTGRIIDPVGRPMDEQGPVQASENRPIERPAPPMMARAPVEVPLQTGLKVVDALIPIGRGQRELIVGDRQTGKTAITMDTIINQRNKDVICVYCAIGQKSSDVARFISRLREHGAMEYSIIVVANGEAPPGIQFVAPYAATSIAEYFMDQGQDALIIYDDLTQHARAYRELSLLLRRPPAREAYPGDIFYIHSRLLERATHYRNEKGGGSLTALPIVETQAQNISAYIPTNLISITDGQIYLSPDLFRKGVLPSVDVGKSVSRVGGKTQLKAYRKVAGDLRLSYSQFEELESFARFSTRLDEETKKKLERGKRVREILKQPQYEPIPAPEQIAVLLAITEGIFDQIPVDKIADSTEKIRKVVREKLQEISDKIIKNEALSDDDQKNLLQTIKDVLNLDQKEEADEDA